MPNTDPAEFISGTKQSRTDIEIKIETSWLAFESRNRAGVGVGGEVGVGAGLRVWNWLLLLGLVSNWW